MSDVVLRCSNCGTTQSTPGECEACHEATVRYFCPNHTPGRWLDGPVCAECGSRAERERRARRPRSPSPTTPPPRRAETLPPAPPSRRTGRVRPTARPAPPPVEEDEFPPVRVPPVRVPPTRRRARAEVSDADGVVVARPTAPPRWPRPPIGVGTAVRRGIPLVGCVVRLVLVLALLTLLAVAALFTLLGGGAAVRSWVVDVGQSTGLLEGVPEQTRRGVAAYEAGNRATAERQLREAARLYPRSALALLYLARISSDAGELDQAGEYLRAAVAREPDNPLPHRELAAHYVARARAASESGDPGAARDDLAEAERYYALALRLDPDHQPTLGYYGCVLAQQGRGSEAARALEQAGTGAWQRCAPAPASTSGAPLSP